MNDGLDYPETLDDYGPDPFGDSELYQAEYEGCDDEDCQRGTRAGLTDFADCCADCLNAFECESPEELAITLGDLKKEAPDFCMICGVSKDKIYHVHHPITTRLLYLCKECLNDICYGRIPSPQ